MILVDIYVPSVEQTYDFNIDENAPVSSVIEEVAAMVSQKEQCILRGRCRFSCTVQPAPGVYAAYG